MPKLTHARLKTQCERRSMTGATIGRGPREGMEPWTWTWAPSNKSPLDSKHLRVACHLVDFWLRPDISQQCWTCCYVCDPCSQVCRIEFRPTCCNVQRKLSDPKHKFALFKLHKLGKLLDSLTFQQYMHYPALPVCMHIYIYIYMYMILSIDLSSLFQSAVNPQQHYLF